MFFTRFVQTRLADDRVDRDRRFTGRTVADDQFPLPAPNRNHRVDRHDAGLYRLAHALSFDNAGRNFFERIKRFAFYRPFIVERLTERVHDPAKQSFADRNREQPPRRLSFIAFGNFRRVAEQNRADLGLFQVQGETEHAVRELDHFIQHDIAQTFDASDAVTGFAHDADVAFPGRGL